MTKSQCRRILLGLIIWLIVLSPIVIALTWTIISPEQTPFVWAGINSNHSVAIKVNIAFNLLMFFFHSFIFQAIVINGKLEKDISGCLKYPENVAKTMHPPSEVTLADSRTELFQFNSQNYICDETQPK